jgi:carbon-monoxide dehydrogenase small subunit
VTAPQESLDVSFVVNGEPVEVHVAARRLLVDVLREDLGLTGTHIGCEHGICGACTVLIDGEPSRACITLAAQADGAGVTTIEGLTPEHGLSRLQEAFRDEHGLQCGFCTPGFIVTIAAADPADYPDDDAIRELLSGNLCRCTGYEQIVASVRVAWGR